MTDANVITIDELRNNISCAIPLLNRIAGFAEGCALGFAGEDCESMFASIAKDVDEVIQKLTGGAE